MNILLEISFLNNLNYEVMFGIICEGPHEGKNKCEIQSEFKLYEGMGNTPEAAFEGAFKQYQGSIE